MVRDKARCRDTKFLKCEHPLWETMGINEVAQRKDRNKAKDLTLKNGYILVRERILIASKEHGERRREWGLYKVAEIREGCG